MPPSGEQRGGIEAPATEWDELSNGFAGTGDHDRLSGGYASDDVAPVVAKISDRYCRFHDLECITRDTRIWMAWINQQQLLLTPRYVRVVGRLATWSKAVPYSASSPQRRRLPSSPARGRALLPGDPSAEAVIPAWLEERSRLGVGRRWHYDADYDLIAEVTGQATEWVVSRGVVS